MPGVALAPLAVLVQRDAIRVVALGLVGLVVPALALLTGEGDCDPDISAGHLASAPRAWVVRRRAKENPAPARGRRGRIARSGRGLTGGSSRARRGTRKVRARFAERLRWDG